MNPAILAASQANDLWYALPLIVVISLVYAATRHEEMGAILLHALRFGMMVVGFMTAVLVVLVAVSHFGGVVLGVLALLGLGWWLARTWHARRAAARQSPRPPARRAETRPTRQTAPQDEGTPRR